MDKPKEQIKKKIKQDLKEINGQEGVHTLSKCVIWEFSWLIGICVYLQQIQIYTCKANRITGPIRLDSQKMVHCIR